MTTQSKSAHARSVLQNNMFWVCVLFVAAGSVGCFGYAGIQLKSNEQQRRQDDDGMEQNNRLRQPLLFERTTPPTGTALPAT